MSGERNSALIKAEIVQRISKEGGVVWQVPHFDWVKGNSPYTEIDVADEGTLVRLWNYRCTNIFLDPLTGRFVREQISH